MSDFALEPLLPVIPQGTANSSGLTSGGPNADFDSFLTLLTAQLRNQDPLAPLESTEFIAQLASFSTVEQLIGANEFLETISAQNTAGQVADLASWIGRNVTSLDGAFRATGEPIAFSAPKGIAADRVEAEVLTADGTVLRTFPVTLDENGNSVWDGKNNAGATVAPQDLIIRLKFFDAGAVAEERFAQIQRTVIGVRGTRDGALLETADGGMLSPQDVGRIS